MFVGDLKGGDLGRKCFGVDVEDVSKVQSAVDDELSFP